MSVASPVNSTELRPVESHHQTGESPAVRSCLLKVLEEILQLEEIVRTSKEDTEDLKNRVEQLELFIENHHKSLVTDNTAGVLPKSPETHETNTKTVNENAGMCPVKPAKHDIKSDDEIQRRFLSRRELLYDKAGLHRGAPFQFFY